MSYERRLPVSGIMPNVTWTPAEGCQMSSERHVLGEEMIHVHDKTGEVCS